MYDVIAIGPARMDVFVKLPDGEVEEMCSIDRKKCMISLGYGDKIPINQLELEIGGNAGNHAVGVTRLGFKAAMIAGMGGGYLDQITIQKLQAEGVDTRYVQQTGEDFGLGVVINYQEERTILSHYVGQECQFPTDPGLKAKWIYLTSAGEKFENLYSQAVAWAVKTGAKVAFNPSTRQIKFKDKLAYAYQATEVIFLNKEETQFLLDTKEDDIKKLLEQLRTWGPKVCILTDGPNGAFAYDGKIHYFQPTIDAPVVERTGAGDAFGSGFMAAYMQGKDIQTSLIWGATNSASVLGFVGPQKGLLKKGEMEKRTRP